MQKNQNPINIIKANDYSDEDIVKYWIAMGFESVIDVKQPPSKFILGGKGCGKTHFVRYFAFNSQKIKSENNKITLKEQIFNDEYIGIYLLCSGINAGRFKDKNDFFRYAFELQLSLLLIDILLHPEVLEIIGKENEKKLCLKLSEKFQNKEEFENLNELKQFLLTQKKSIDFYINNLSIHRTVTPPQILINPGDLIFGIPEICSPFLNNIKFTYLIDEYEGFTEEQQQFVNTLVRDKNQATIFIISTRYYGMKEKLETMSDKETIKQGNEYDLIHIDSIIQNNLKRYRNAAKKLIKAKLVGIDAQFEERSDKDLFKKIQDCDSGNRIYLTKFRNYLKTNYALKANEIEENISLFYFEEDPIKEKLCILMFLKLKQKSMKNKEIIFKNMKEIAEIATGNGKKYINIKNHYNDDMILQLYKDFKLEYRYAGEDTLISITEGYPRSLIILLKKIIDKYMFNNGELNESITISPKIQNDAVNEVALSFFDDWSNDAFDNAKTLRQFTEKICNFIKRVRYSDNPSECSLSMFQIDHTSLDTKLLEIVDNLYKYSMLTYSQLVKSKNIKMKTSKYQVNSVIAPLWNISLKKRGTITLNHSELSELLDSNNNNEKSISKRLKLMNPISISHKVNDIKESLTIEDFIDENN